jgi:hypothetical protein
MALSRLAQEMAAEIRQHDWSDAPWRADRAGHNYDTDSNRGQHRFGPGETSTIRLNVMWVTAQVLGHADPNFNVFEYAEACGVNTLTQYGRKNGGITSGLRIDHTDPTNPRYCYPGTWEPGTGRFIPIKD